MKLLRNIGLTALSLLLMISCGKPTDPESLMPDNTGGYHIVKKYATTAFAQDIVRKDKILYIAQGEGGLIIIDIQDPKNPKTLSSITEGVRGHSKKIALKDSVVYLAAGNYGITAVNIANPNQPNVTVSNLNMKPAKNVFVLGDYLFASVSERGVKIANIGYPTQPDIRGRIITYGYAHDVAISKDTLKLFAACGEVGLTVFDISDFQNGFGVYPPIISVNTPGYAESIVISDEKSLAFMACGTAGLQIIDYSDMNQLHIVGSYNSSGYAKELKYRNDKVYMTTEKSGLQVFDVKNASKPKLIAQIKTEYALGIEIDDKYIFVADEQEGLIIISIP